MMIKHGNFGVYTTITSVTSLIIAVAYAIWYTTHGIHVVTTIVILILHVELLVLLMWATAVICSGVNNSWT